MTNDKIRFMFFSPSTKFYGTMYGGKYGVHEWDKIIEIDKKDIKISIDGNSFYYVWGWPGPDVNFYEFKDYGLTWAFDKKDFKGVN